MMAEFFVPQDIAKLVKNLVNESYNRYVGPLVKLTYTPEPWSKRVLKTAPTGTDDLYSGQHEFQVNAIADGTNTYVEVIDNHGRVAGQGYARRRKGDRRSKDIGMALASARAFQDAAKFYARVAEELLT